MTSKAWWPGLLAVLVFLLYVPVLDHVFVTFDDGFLVAENERVQRFDPRIWWTYDPELYIPLTLFTYQIDHVLLGGSALAVHAVSVLWHLCACLLVFGILRRLDFTAPLAFAGALLFGIHPLQVESVAWASARKELVYAVFFLLALWCYLGSHRWQSVASHAAALLGKVTAVTLPVVLLAFDAFRFRRLTWSMVGRKWPYFLLSLAFGVVALLGKTSDVVLSPLETLLLAFRTSAFFLVKFLVPTNLAVLHPVTEPIRISDAVYFGPILLAGALFGAAVFLRKRLPRFGLGLAFFALTLAPSFLGYAKAGQIQLASEHYVYLPLFGLVIMLMPVVILINKFVHKSVSLLLIIAFVLFLLPITWQRIDDWKNSESLYLRALEVYPRSHVAASNLAAVYLEDGRTDDAIVYLNKALTWEPEYASAYANLSEALRRKGDFMAAQKASIRALELDPSLENTYQNQKSESRNQNADVDAEISRVRQELEKNPDNADLWWQLGGLYGQKEMYREGLEAFLRAAELDPARVEQAEELRKILETMNNAE